MAKAPKPIVDTTWMLNGVLCWVDLEGVDPMFSAGVIQSVDKKTNIANVVVNGKVSQVKAQLLLERAEPGDKLGNGFEDMVNMETLNDAELLANLVLRFRIDEIFTYVGPTLLVMNPFKRIEVLLSTETRDKYVKHIVGMNRSYKDLQPHVFALAAQAFKNLFDNEKNQAIVISGESGAGKTENAKFAMNLLTSIASEAQAEGQVKIEDQILGCNPILEAFGNAKTVRNNNSSRFGKYTRIMVDEDTKRIRGAEIVNYLLEKSRINQQGKNERNFHIFYFLLKGMTPEQLTKFQLDVPIESFSYLNSSNTYTVSTIDDAECFREISQCFHVLGMSTDYDDIMAVVAAVLLLGNVQFDGSGMNDTTSATLINDKVCSLIGLNPEQLRQALTLKQRTIQQQVINSPLTLEECQFTRDTLAKDLFDRLFNWLVTQLNVAIAPKEQCKTAVGLLDIYGFEVFDKNTFEQVMINYTNEKLHQLYISYVFKEEENIFNLEGLKEFYSSIEFQDNTGVIELLDSRQGIFGMLEESCQVKSTDDALLQKIRTSHKQNPLLKNPRMPSEPAFIIVHTAKDVAYTITGFRDKNKDEMSQMTLQTMLASTNSLVLRLYKMESAKDKFISQKIKKEMSDLMAELNSCDVHFVRCIKPNDSKKPQELWPEMTLKQIRYLGVLDSLKVRKESYSIRRLYQSLYKKYGNITKNKIYPELIKDPTVDFRSLVIAMFKDYFPQFDAKVVLFGKTRIFLRQQIMLPLEECWQKYLEEKMRKARRLQKAWAVHKINKRMRVLIGVAFKLKSLAIRVRYRTLQKKRLRNCIFIQLWWKHQLRKRWQKKYQQASKSFQMYIKRFYQMELATRKNNAILKLQGFAHMIKRTKHLKKQREINLALKTLLDKTWNQIRERKAIQIQKFCRGFKVRKQFKDECNKIKLAGRMTKLDASIRMIQNNARIYIAKKYYKRARNAVYKIQGFMRMIWLSALFQRIRKAIPLIQKHAKRYVAQLRNNRALYQQFVSPSELLIQQQRADAQSFWLLWNEQDTPLLESCLIQWRPNLNKIALFAVPIDIQILSDLSLIYNPTYSYSRTILNILIQQLRKDHPIQSFHVSEQSTILVSLGGASIFEFGESQLILNNYSSDQVEKIILPDFGKVKSISAGDSHLLVTASDGTLMQYANDIKFKPYVYDIQADCVSSSYIVSEGKVVNWVCGRFELPIKPKVKSVAVGSQFGVLLTESGQVFTWGENVEGELGLGDTRMRTEPCLVRVEKERILQIACGLKHVCVRARSKIFTWGWGERGQLGHGNFKNDFSPKIINKECQWVSCGRTSSFYIQDGIPYTCGTNGSISYQCKFENMHLNVSVQQMYAVRVISTFSKTIEITYVTFANCISSPVNIAKRQKILEALQLHWGQSSDPLSIDPPYSQTLSNYLYEASMKKPQTSQRQQIANYYRNHRETLYIEDDRQWAQQKKLLVQEIQHNKQQISKTDKLSAIRERYLKLISEPSHTFEEKQFLNVIQNNEKLLSYMQSQ